MPACRWGVKTLVKYRTPRNYQDPEFLGSRLGDKIIMSTLMWTLYWCAAAPRPRPVSGARRRKSMDKGRPRGDCFAPFRILRHSPASGFAFLHCSFIAAPRYTTQQQHPADDRRRSSVSASTANSAARCFFANHRRRGIGDSQSILNIINLPNFLFMWCILPAFGAAGYSAPPPPPPPCMLVSTTSRQQAASWRKIARKPTTGAWNDQTPVWGSCVPARSGRFVPGLLRLMKKGPAVGFCGDE